jgi:hypothetical protein
LFLFSYLDRVNTAIDRRHFVNLFVVCKCSRDWINPVVPIWGGWYRLDWRLTIIAPAQYIISLLHFCKHNHIRCQDHVCLLVTQGISNFNDLFLKHDLWYLPLSLLLMLKVSNFYPYVCDSLAPLNKHYCQCVERKQHNTHCKLGYVNARGSHYVLFHVCQRKFGFMTLGVDIGQASNPGPLGIILFFNLQTLRIF